MRIRHGCSPIADKIDLNMIASLAPTLELAVPALRDRQRELVSGELRRMASAAKRRRTWRWPPQPMVRAPELGLETDAW
jgi:hypothetical protein